MSEVTKTQREGPSGYTYPCVFSAHSPVTGLPPTQNEKNSKGDKSLVTFELQITIGSDSYQ